MKNVCVVILGGGRGSRLFPLTGMRSKPAVPFGAEFRLIDIPISNCINSGLNNIFVLTQFLMASLQRHLYQTYKFDNFSSGFVEVLSAEQTNDSIAWYQGTADAVRKQRHHFLDDKYDYILVLSGDHLYQMDYRKFLEHHIQENADITIGAYPVSKEKVAGFGVFQADDNGQIRNFYEKPKDPDLIENLRIPDLDPSDQSLEFLASMGIYIFNREVLRKLLEGVAEDDFGSGIIPEALNHYKVCSYLYNGYWEDIGTIKAFFDANLALTAPIPQFNLYDLYFPLYTRPRFLAPSKISGDAVVDNSILGNGSLIQNSKIQNSIIGIRSIIKENVHMDRVVMMGADYYRFEENEDTIPLGIGKDTVIQNAIIDKNARIGHDCRFVNEKELQVYDGDNYYIRDGIIIIPKKANIPPGTVI